MDHEHTTYVIAEAGVNHNGSLESALRLVEVAADAGADAVKFQSFRAEKIVGRFAPKAAYQNRTTDAAESQLEMVRRLELSPEAHRALRARCDELEIEFLSTPFDRESVELLVELGVQRLKIPSGEITNAPLLLDVASAGLPLIISTGMATLGEVETALGTVAFALVRGEAPGPAAFQAAFASDEGQRALRERVALLHCTTEYPAAVGDVNLRAMHTLAAAFGLPVGLSDHTAGTHIAVAATALGATIIEKHFTLDRELPGPDHRASLEPDELKAMIRMIRDTEAALGSGRKLPARAELANRAVARRSLVAGAPIARGTPFSAANLVAKRPGTGISPLHWWEWIGRPAERDYEADEVIGT